MAILPPEFIGLDIGQNYNRRQLVAVRARDSSSGCLKINVEYDKKKLKLDGRTERRIERGLRTGQRDEMAEIM